jgi:hypothetical protein
LRDPEPPPAKREPQQSLPYPERLRPASCFVSGEVLEQILLTGDPRANGRRLGELAADFTRST